MKPLLLALCLAAVPGAAAPIREVQTECPILSGQPICQFRDGRLFKFAMEAGRILSVYARDGHFDFLAPVQLPGAAVTWTYDVAVDPDGGFAVAAQGGLGDMRSMTKAGVALLDAHGIQTGSIDTGVFKPAHIAIADDHSIWVLGSQLQAQKGDYMVLRRYSRDGMLLGSWLPRSTFPAGLEPGTSFGSVRVLATGNRIALVVSSGTLGSQREVIELDIEGNLLGRMRIDDHASAQFFALTTDGNLYGWFGKSSGASALTLFDPKAGTAVDLDHPDARFMLLGADGTDLVFRVPGGEAGAIKEAWYRQPAR